MSAVVVARAGRRRSMWVPRWSNAVSVVALTLSLSMVAGFAFAYWTAPSTSPGIGSAAATSLSQGVTPTATATGGAVTVSWAASTLASGEAATGYTVKRYNATSGAQQTIAAACSGTISARTCTETGVPTGNWKYSVTPYFGTNWRGLESARSATLSVDPTPPVNNLTLVVASGNAYLGGNTVFYRGAAAGSLQISNAVSDTGSGPKSSTTSTLSGASTAGFTHTPSTVNAPVGGPYVSNAISWASATSSAPSVVVTASDVAGSTAAITLSFVNDSTPPTAGTLTYTNGDTTNTAQTITFSAGTDAGSGIASSSLQRQSSTLTGITCGTYDAFVPIATNTTSPFVDTVLNNRCYKYQYVVTDRLGNATTTTSSSVTRVGGYAATVLATSSLVNYFRLNDVTKARDTFTGDPGTKLQLHDADTGEGWTKRAEGITDAVLTNAGRLRKGGTNTYASRYLSEAVPDSANYTVSVDIVTLSTVTNDRVGVTGRTDPAAETYYGASYERLGNVFVLARSVAGVWTALGSVPAVVANGTTTSLALDMNGSRIRLLVNGVERIVYDEANGAGITAAGRGGVSMGFAYSGGELLTTITNTTGMHLDNFAISTGAVDATGANRGVYVNGPTLGVPGALTDSSTAVTFDGVDDYATTARQISNNFTIEFWMKSTGGYGTGSNWWQGAALVDADFSGSANDFGVRLLSGGRIAAGTEAGGTSASAVSSPGYNDGNWHHVVFTRDSSTGALQLYIDGVPNGAATGATGPLTSQANLTFGRAASGDYFYPGSLDEVAIYSTVLTAATVAAHFAAR